MSYLQDHLKTCSYCREKYSQSQKPRVRIKAASSYKRQKKLSELGAIIRGTSYPSVESIPISMFQPKGASNSNAERKMKLAELGKMIRG